MRKHYLCPRCGGETFQEQIKHLLRGGDNTAIVLTVAYVCERCHDWLFQSDQVLAFEQIEALLERGDTDGFRPRGRTFEVDLPETAWNDTLAAVHKGE